MRDPDVFGRIDRTLNECDASQLPPLADTPITLGFDGAGDATHIVAIETGTGRIAYPPEVISVEEAWQRLGYRVETHSPGVTVVAAHGTARPVGEDDSGQRIWVVPVAPDAAPYPTIGVDEPEPGPIARLVAKIFRRRT